MTEILEREQPGVEGGQEEALAQRDLLRGFAELPEEQRAVLLLIAVEDFSYRETARVLGLPIGTVMSRLSRGRERLRQYVNGDQARARLGLQTTATPGPMGRAVPVWAAIAPPSRGRQRQKASKRSPIDWRS